MVRAMNWRALATLLLCLWPLGARSESATPHVQLSMATRMEAGGVQAVAFRFALDPGWHLYWRNPGETGLPTDIAWSLPAGVSAGAIAWPVPERFTSGPLVNYGYAGAAILSVPLSGSLKGSAMAQLSWLACAQMCIPESANLPVPLGRSSGDAALFAQTGLAARNFSGKARARANASGITLTLLGAQLAGIRPADIRFFPETRRAIDDAAMPRIARDGSALVLTFRRHRRPHPLTQFAGVLVAGNQALEIAAPVVVGPVAGAATLGASGQGDQEVTLLGAILAAFLGGLILNLMPCVLPILSMKALAFARAGESTAELRREGLYYFLGVVVSFAVVAAALLGLRAAGAEAGWGFQLQSPAVVALLALLCAAVGFNFLGYFEIPASFAGLGSGTVEQSGLRQRAFLTGVLAVLVASPCTAPFMGASVGFALTQPPALAVAVFMALACGFAAPFTALTFLPGLVRLIPRPGRWMIRFKEFLGFPMLATAVWLLWVLTLEAGAGGVALALGVAIAAGFAFWLADGLPRPLHGPVAILGVAAAGAALFLLMPTAPQANQQATADGWRAWSPQAVAQAQASGQPVFVDFTAAWCVTCQVNERVALDDGAVRERLARDRVVLLKGDWTNRDGRIAAALARYGRAGVPLYLYYPAGAATPVVLPQLLTPSGVLAALDRH